MWGVYDTAISGWETVSMDGLIDDGAAEAAAEWASAQGCSSDGSTPYETVSDGIVGWTCTQHDDGTAGTDVVTCQWDGDHFWARDTSNGDDLWPAVWEHFQAHPRAEGRSPGVGRGDRCTGRGRRRGGPGGASW